MSEPIYISVGFIKTHPNHPQAVQDLLGKCTYFLLDTYTALRQLPADKIFRISVLYLYDANPGEIMDKASSELKEFVKGKSVVFVNNATIDNMIEYFDLRNRMEVLSERVKESLIPINYEK